MVLSAFPTKPGRPHRPGASLYTEWMGKKDGLFALFRLGGTFGVCDTE
jgi:hypothetical protein